MPTSYAWLREAIAIDDFQARGCAIEPDEIFISDGSKCDSGNILDIFGHDNTIAVTDPVYPVYIDTNVMAGNTGDANDKGEYGRLVYLLNYRRSRSSAQLHFTDRN